MPRSIVEVSCFGKEISYFANSVISFDFLSFSKNLIELKNLYSYTSPNCICIYRPPARTHKCFDEFPRFLETTLQFQEDVYVFGDFNIHLGLPSLNTRSFLDVIQIYALDQHVSFPGHWLDLFTTRSTCINIKAIFPTGCLSDHHCVIFDLWLQVRSRPRKKLSHFDQ